ncbi:hydrogenase small subunit [Kaarinaea lacus]
MLINRMPDLTGLDNEDSTLGGVTRREFMKFCAGIAATMGLSSTMAVRIAEAATSPGRPPVIWVSAQACTGCTESLLRAEHPTLEQLILESISLDYHETLSAGAGHQAEAYKHHIMETHKGKYILVTDGSIPTRDGGIYCKIADRTVLEIVQEVAADAAAVVAIGSCASWGGIPSSGPNPTDAKATHEIITDKPVVNIPGCPPNPYNFLATVLHLLTFNSLPELDDKGRPKFAYGRLIHENCERRPHFDAGRFAIEFGDEGHRRGWCLYKLGCKGPETYANCPAVLFGDVGPASWPVGTGHPCFGCTEQGIGFHKPLHALADVKTVAPPNTFTDIFQPKGEGVTAGTAALAAGVIGAGVGAAAVAASRMGKDDESSSGSSSSKDE